MRFQKINIVPLIDCLLLLVLGAFLMTAKKGSQPDFFKKPCVVMFTGDEYVIDEEKIRLDDIEGFLKRNYSVHEHYISFNPGDDTKSVDVKNSLRKIRQLGFDVKFSGG